MANTSPLQQQHDHHLHLHLRLHHHHHHTSGRGGRANVDSLPLLDSRA